MTHEPTLEEIANQFIVILVNKRTGSLTLATTPYIHRCELDAKNECERLSRNNPGMTFTYWQFRGACIKHDVEWTIPMLSGEPIAQACRGCDSEPF